MAAITLPVVTATTPATQPTAPITLPTVTVTTASGLLSAAITLPPVVVTVPVSAAVITLPPVTVSAVTRYTVPAGQVHLDSTGLWKPFIVAHLGADGIWRNLADGAVVNYPTAMPTTETLAGFAYDYGQDFLTNVAEGGFTNVTTGSDLGLLATPAAYATGAGKFKTKAENSTTGEANAVYSAVRTTSVTDSVFRVRMHWDGATAVAGAIKPIPPSANATDQSQLYGRWRYRMRLAPSTDSGWGSVADLINSNTWATGTGEYGHPENGHATGNLGAWIRPSNHLTNPNTYKTRRDYATNGLTSANLNDWHVYEIRCEPGRTRLIVDNVTIWDDTVTPVSDPLSWVMQCGKPGTPAAGTEATVEIDWITISRWVGP